MEQIEFKLAYLHAYARFISVGRPYCRSIRVMKANAMHGFFGRCMGEGRSDLERFTLLHGPKSSHGQEEGRRGFL